MGHLKVSAIERTIDVLPVPGAPCSATGTLAKIERPTAAAAFAVDPMPTDTDAETGSASPCTTNSLLFSVHLQPICPRGGCASHLTRRVRRRVAPLVRGAGPAAEDAQFAPGARRDAPEARLRRRPARGH